MIKNQVRYSLNSLTDDLNPDTIRISYIDWYPGFSETDNLLTRLLDLSSLQYQVSDVAFSDVIVAGCYGDSLASTPQISSDKLVLFISGENLNPIYSLHDFSLTTIPHSFGGKNCRMPQWFGEIHPSYDNFRWLPSEYSNFPLTAKRDIPISAIYNNSTPLRDYIISILRDSFGDECVQIFGSHRGKEVNKHEILSRSQVNICFENSIGEGYVTEKLLHSMMHGCSSLYWGDSWHHKDFRVADTFDFYSDSSIDNLISWVRHQLMLTKPVKNGFSNLDTSLFTSTLDFHPIVKHLQKIFRLVLNLRGVHI